MRSTACFIIVTWPSVTVSANWNGYFAFYSQLPQGRVQNNNTVLRLLHVSKTDSDTYQCSASNILGSAARRTHLVVVMPPKFITKPPTKLEIFTDDNVTLNCSAAGDPKPTIRWTRQGGQLPLGRSHMLGEALIISEVKVEDTGNYTCIAKSAGVSKAFAMSYVVMALRGKFVWLFNPNITFFEMVFGFLVVQFV